MTPCDTERQPAAATNLLVLDYWRKLCPSDGLPGRSDIDPLDIPTLLPNVYLVDVSHDPLDFRYRLIGTAIVDRSMRDYTGMWLREIPMQAPPSQIWSLFKTAVHTRRPACTMIPYRDQERRFVEKQCLPLSRDGNQVNMLFGSIVFEQEGEVYPDVTRKVL